MLGKITSYNKIGNKKEIEFILNYIIKSKRSINRNSFIEYCSESNISLQSTKCTLLLLKYLGIISPDGREGFKFTLKGFDTRQQVKMLITQVFKKLTEDDVLRHFINKQVV